MKPWIPNSGRWMSYFETWDQLIKGTKDRTSRSSTKPGERHKPSPAYYAGQIVRPVEWPWRVGPRWTCLECPWMGPTQVGVGAERTCPSDKLAGRHSLVRRNPRGFGQLLLLEVGVERLGTGLVRGSGTRFGTWEHPEVRREGFREWAAAPWGPEAFLSLYAGANLGGWSPSDPIGCLPAAASRKIQTARDYRVARIIFARVDLDGIVRRQAITAQLGEWDAVEGLPVAEAREVIEARTALGDAIRKEEL